MNQQTIDQYCADGKKMLKQVQSGSYRAVDVGKFIEEGQRILLFYPTPSEGPKHLKGAIDVIKIMRDLAGEMRMRDLERIEELTRIKHTSLADRLRKTGHTALAEWMNGVEAEVERILFGDKPFKAEHSSGFERGVDAVQHEVTRAQMRKGDLFSAPFEQYLKR